MQLLLGSMCRTGMNAIGRWLLRQSNLFDRELEYVHGDWVEYYSGYMYMTMINHPEHYPIHRGIIDEYMPGHIIMTVERNSREAFQHYMELYPLFEKAIIVREFKNWAVSVCNMHGELNWTKLVPSDVKNYISLIKDKECFKIKYDDWCNSQMYRLGICASLELRFTDYGINDVSPNGHGSSFDGMKYNGRATAMQTTQRYKQFESDRNFKLLLERYSEALELSDEFFK